jgi:predicted nucleotidyltransferase
MRIKNREADIIKNTVKGFDPEAEVFLFGSRVDDQLKGGDIDILIFSESMNLRSKLQLKSRLFEKLEEQKIDIIIEKNRSAPFIIYVLQNAIQL